MKITNRKNTDPFAIQAEKLRGKKLDTLYRSQWSEDAYIAEPGNKGEAYAGFNAKRLPFIGALVAVLSFIVLARTAWLQIIKGDHYFSMAEVNRIRTERLEPKRGVIYDRNMNALVRNKANFMLYFVPVDLPSGSGLEEIMDDISSLMPKLKKEDLYESIKRVNKYSLEAYQPLFAADNIPYEKAMKLYLKTMSWPGVVLSSRTSREYLNFSLKSGHDEGEEPLSYRSLSHIIGYTGKISREELEDYGDEYLPIDYIGKMGIEYFWENELKGLSGEKKIEVDALGKEKKIIGRVESQDGNNLVLSLDVNQQLKLEDIFLRHLRELGLSRAVGIVLDPDNGEIFAMVSLPSYDNNVFARGIKKPEYEQLVENSGRPLFNRAISGEYPSGSTFKPIVAAAALEERIVSENTRFLSTGGIGIGQWFFPDWRAGGHGRINVREAIANSVNTYFYYIGGGYDDFSGLGVDKITEYAKLFGLGAQTGVDLAGEREGLVPGREWKEAAKGERWYIGDTYHLAIGQGDLLVTPLQVAMYTGVFANGGKLYRPHFVKSVLSGNDEPVMETDAAPIREGFISDYNMMVVREGLRDTVRYGSARSLQSVEAAVAGKTGTAQWSSKKENHAWFTGFAPFDDPEIVISILIEEGGEGSSVAVPLAREFLKWYFGEYKK